MDEKPTRRECLQAIGASALPIVSLSTGGKSVRNRRQTTTQSISENTWPMFQANAANTGYLPNEQVGEPSSSIWTSNVDQPRSRGSDFGAGPPNPTGISADTNRAYLGRGKGFYALQRDSGEVVWADSFDHSGRANGPPAVGSDAVYFASEYRNWSGGSLISSRGWITAYDLSGNQIWDVSVNGSIRSRLTLGTDRLYFGEKPDTTDGRLTAIDTGTGEVAWSKEMGYGVFGTPAVSDGMVYAVDSAPYNELRALDAEDGTEIWRFSGEYAGITDSQRCGGPCFTRTGPTVVGDTVYYGTHGRYVYALNRQDGQKQWKFEADGRVTGSVAAGDQTVFAVANPPNGNGNATLHAIHDGSSSWDIDIGTNWGKPPVVTSETVLVARSDGTVLGVSISDGQEMWSFETDGDEGISDLSVVNGTVYVSSSAGTAYALDTSTGSSDPDSEITTQITQIQADDFPDIDTYVSVQNDTGDPIANLTESDFDLREESTSQTITNVKTVGNSSSTISAALLMDTSGSMSSRITDARAGAKSFVDNLESGDQAAVIEYNDQVSISQAFTTDMSAVDTAIDSLSTGGETALFDGLEEAINLTATTEGRKAIILLADGDNNLDPDSDGLTVDNVINMANRDSIPIYTIGLNTDDYDPTNLQRLADETGGLFFEAADSSNLTQIYNDISESISSEYLVQYTTSNSTRDGTERTVEVTATANGQSGSDSATYTAPSPTGDQNGTVRPASTEVSVDGNEEMVVTLSGFENGFAGAEFEFTMPDIVLPTSVSANSQYGLRDTDISGQTVTVQVSDTQGNFSGQLADIELCRIQLQGVSEGTGTVSVNPIQVDNDNGASVSMTVEAGSGTITVTDDTCAVVNGTETTDPDGDGKCEDFNGNDRMDFDDVNTFFDNINNDDVTSEADAFDFNDNGRIDFDDINTLFDEITQN